MSDFDGIRQIVCINLLSRIDRFGHMLRQGLEHDFDFTVIEACTPENAVENSPFVAFNTSQQTALKSLNKFPAMILEDDCVFQGTGHLSAALKELPADFDVLYLGANIIGIDVIPFKPPVRYSPHLFTLIDAWQTHAMVYSKKGVEKILSKFSVTCGYNFDEFLRQEIMPDGKCFIIAPQISYQLPSYSNIWNVDTDFSHLYEAGNKLLM